MTMLPISASQIYFKNYLALCFLGKHKAKCDSLKSKPARQQRSQEIYCWQ